MKIFVAVRDFQPIFRSNFSTVFIDLTFSTFKKERFERKVNSVEGLENLIDWQVENYHVIKTS